MMKAIVLLGSPGSGKGTQSKLLAKRIGASLVGMGDLLRSEIRNQSDIGCFIKPIVESGGFPELKIVMEVLKRRITKSDSEKIIFDGFPRDLLQANALENILLEQDGELKAVFLLSVPIDILMQRMLGRFICANCGTMYSKGFREPKEEGVCDVCRSSEFMKRKDDEEAIIKHRLRIDEEKSEKLASFYKSRGTFLEVDGGKPVEVINNIIAGYLNDCCMS